MSSTYRWNRRLRHRRHSLHRRRRIRRILWCLHDSCSTPSRRRHRHRSPLHRYPVTRNPLSSCLLCNFPGTSLRQHLQHAWNRLNLLRTWEFIECFPTTLICLLLIIIIICREKYDWKWRYTVKWQVTVDYTYKAWIKVTPYTEDFSYRVLFFVFFRYLVSRVYPRVVNFHVIILQNTHWVWLKKPNWNKFKAVIYKYTDRQTKHYVYTLWVYKNRLIYRTQ